MAKHLAIGGMLACFLLCTLNTAEGKRGFGFGAQDWGFVTVRKSAHMFYWLYYKNTVSVQSATKAPLVIWLQGGPGASSSYGNFEEFGTLYTNESQRPSAWTKHVNVLYIDNPVGTGYSHVDNLSALTKNNDQIAEDLLTFIKAFYKKHRVFSKTPLYVFSESYGGKMAIQFSYVLAKEIKKHKLKINFKGVALGDGWLSPIDSCLTWAPFLFHTGEIDYTGYARLNETAEQLNEAVKAGQWKEATNLWARLERVVSSVTNGVDFYNILYRRHYGGSTTAAEAAIGARRGLKMQTRDDAALERLMNGKVKSALKIPNKVTWDGQGNSVFRNLWEDFMKPATRYVEKVLDETNLKVVIYTGHLDLIVDTPGTLNWVQRLKWKDANHWISAEKTGLGVSGVLEGFVKSYGKFSFYWLLNAGHMVPTDNPEGSLKMLQLVTGY